MKFLLLVHVVLIYAYMVLAEVILPNMPNFQNCFNFFANPGGITAFPTIFTPSSQYKQICQRYNNLYEFATLYDTSNRIPVYSAYLYQGNACCQRTNRWLIEPQLDDMQAGSNMAPSSTVNRSVVGTNQALNRDYQNSGFDKGHLYPVFHTFQNCTAKATFTLTNAAPQDPSFNRKEWFNNVEVKIKNILEKYCHANLAYVVTGVVPGNTQIKRRVTIPAFFWSAYCCVDNNLRPLYSKAYISPNKNGGIIGPIPVHNSQTQRSLEDILSDQNHYNTPFSVFGGFCGDNAPPTLT